MAGERFRIADVHEPNEQLQCILEARAGVASAVDAEGQDARRATAHVLARQRVAGVIGQAGVIDPAHLRVPLQVRCHREGIGAYPVHAQRQRLDALQDQEAVERRDRRTHVAQRHDTRSTDEGRGAERLRVDHAVVRDVGRAEARELVRVLRPGELSRVDQRAADAGAVAAQVLGERVHDDVGAVLERPAQVRRGHGVVDDQRNAVPVCHLGQCREVGDVARRVADGLAEYRARARIDEPLERGRVAVVREPHLDAVLRQRVREQVVGAAVEGRRADHVLPSLGDGEDRVRDGGLPRRQRERADAALERGEALLEHVRGRVHDARVDVAGDLEVEQVGAVLGVVERVRRGLVDWHRDGPCRGVGSEACVDDEGLELHGRGRLHREVGERGRAVYRSGWQPCRKRSTMPDWN